eukprot:1417710-Prymnesium_polylepis.1
MDAQKRRSRCGSRTTGAPMRRLRRRRNRRMPERRTHEDRPRQSLVLRPERVGPVARAHTR